MHTGLDPAEGVVLFLSAESVFEGFPGLHAAAGQARAKAAQATQMLRDEALRGWPTAAGMG